MSISEEKLESWARQGAVTTSKNTHESVRFALTSNKSKIKDKNIEIFLQGSYKNTTNIRGDSDVDIVVKLNDTFYKDISLLNEEERNLYNKDFVSANYSWHDFRLDVLETLKEYYGVYSIEEGNKSIKINEGSNRLSADVVVCTQFRKYISYNGSYDSNYIEGISFFTLQENRRVINFPKKHYHNGVEKNRNSNGLLKPMTRIFKNMKSYLVEKNHINKSTAPSYFIENLLYNVSNNQFNGTYQNAVYNILKCLETAEIDKFICQNNVDKLFGDKAEQWNIVDFNKFYANLVALWNKGT